MVWLKRVLLGVAVVIALGILLTAITYRRFHGVPDWYSVRTYTAEQLERASSAAEHKLANLQNWAAETRAKESARINTTGPAATQEVGSSATRPANSTTVEFTEDELNAFFQKWVAAEGWQDKFGKYVSDPAVFLRDGRVILAGTLKETGGVVASFHFEPKIGPNGEFDLRLVKVLGGNLPLPKAVWASQRDKLAQAAGKQLPGWRRQAAIAPNGTANLDAVSAGMTRVLLNVLAGEPSEPVIFLPIAGRGAIPARLSAVSVADKTLSLTVMPMTPAERAAFLARLKGDATQTALAR